MLLAPHPPRNTLSATLPALLTACRHLARKHQLYGANEKDMAQVDVLIDGVEVRTDWPCTGTRLGLRTQLPQWACTIGSHRQTPAQNFPLLRCHIAGR